MLRIFHVPSHLTYVAKLTSAEFAPVPFSTGRPLRLGKLVALGSWDFFDVLHLHTVELATVDDIERVVLRAEREGKGFAFTAHDLEPNIETDRVTFERKTALVASRAAAVITLTKTAAERLAKSLGVAVSAVRVVPHGAALPLSSIGRNSEGTEIAAFGALRPNRDFLSVVHAWRLLTTPRPPLRLLVRSLAEADRQRYAPVLAELEQVARAEPDLPITTTADVVPPGELASWCRRASVLVLPYTRITHSGQLELARDLGVRVVAPSVPTLRAQLDEGPSCPVVWFAPEELDDRERFAGYLQDALSLRPSATDGTAMHEYRAADHNRLLNAHHDAYLSVASTNKVSNYDPRTR